MKLVERTVETLRVLATHPEGLTLSDIGKQVGMPASSTHRLLATLVDQGVALQHLDKRYTLGPEALVLGKGARSVERYAAESIEDLSSRLDQTVFLSRWTGQRVVCTAIAEGGRALRLFVEEGQELPIHAAASARIIAAYLPQEVVLSQLELKPLSPFTSNTPTTPEQVLHILEIDRERGCDISYDELDHGVLSVSAPVWTGEPSRTASITIAGPVSESIVDQTIPVWQEEVLRLASQLSVRDGLAAEPKGPEGALSAAAPFAEASSEYSASSSNIRPEAKAKGRAKERIGK